ncbi:Ig-like domain-containing protein, partial [Methanobrevibacter sp.]
NGTGYYANLSADGSAVVVVPGLKEGNYTAVVTYMGDSNYNNATESVDFKVSGPIVINVDGTGNSTDITVVVPGNVTGGNITVKIDGETVGSDNVTNGSGTVDLGDLAPGEHNVTVIYVDENGVESVVTSTITVPKWNSSVSATSINITENKDEIITITVTPSKASGRVMVDIDGKGYYGNLTDGQVKVYIAGLKEGTYTAYVTYLGDDNYNNSTNTTSFKVSKAITIDMNETVTGDKLVINITLPDDAKGNITVKVGNDTQVVNATGGENIITISNVTQGTQEVNVTYSGDSQYDSVSVVKTIYVSSSVKAEDKLVRGYNSEYDFEAEFLDKNGHVLEDSEVQFVINGKTYTAKTDSKGLAKLTTSKLDVGTYNVTCINPNTGEEITKQLEIVKRIVENNDVTMDFDTGKYYVVRAIGDDGKPVGSGFVVAFKINGIHYVGITDAEGYAKVQINLNPKQYTITAQYHGYIASNKVVVKQTFKLVKKTVTVKKGKKVVLKAKVVLSNGKAVKGKVIKFKFKGKTYKAKTNKKGIAKVVIKKKSVLKKLKKGKKYTYTATYVKNKLKGKVKIK